ncbi:MAG: TOBE domain-containing protein [Defluviicoccus sp.]|nr:TOBE domain-containing protein [Defluviicoccus sp.]MDG4591170.1 TOBE domain-containing protein [Defluviicoccus sp.]MDS4072412.1 TOBE domain-containing protein [Defluviicoccus sp.]
MRTSARNALPGIVKAINQGPIAAEVELEIAPGMTICAIITKRSVTALDLKPGRAATALIKSNFVLLARDVDAGKVSARNCLAGVVTNVIDGPINSELTLDLGGGLELTAIITGGSVQSLGLKPGERASALIKASHIILAVE